VICVGDLPGQPAQIALQNLLEESRPCKSEEDCEDTDRTAKAVCEGIGMWGGIATMRRGHREFEGRARKVQEDLASPRSCEAVDGRRCAHTSITSWI